MKTVLAIGGSDPSGGAGIQADLRTFTSLRVHGVSIPAALTAQNTRNIAGIFTIPDSFFEKQLDTLLDDIHPDAVKTGMLYSETVAIITAASVKKRSLENLVIDPVIISSSGTQLIDDNALDAVKNHLFPLAKVITPNLKESSTIAGLDIVDEESMKKAAEALKGFGPETVIITGGHFKDSAVDLFFDGKEFLFLQREKQKGDYHGTGCVFASAVAASLARGYSTKEAAIKANEFVWSAIQNAFSPGKGMKILGMQ